MDEQSFSDSQLAAIYLEASVRHEQAVATCLEELGDLADLSRPSTRELLLRALMHAERAAACAADAAGADPSVDGAAFASRSLSLKRLQVLALRTLLGGITPS